MRKILFIIACIIPLAFVGCDVNNGCGCCADCEGTVCTGDSCTPCQCECGNCNCLGK
jgi:hypothetical protein